MRALTAEMVEDFIDSFDAFIAALGEHGAAMEAVSKVTARREKPTEAQSERLRAAQSRFETSRDELVAARNRIGPFGSPRKAKEGTTKGLWTPGRA